MQERVDLIDVIYMISPAESPVVSAVKYARVEMGRCKGGAMRKQRRRKAKPIRFTPSVRAKRKVFEWRCDAPIVVQNGDNKEN